MKSRNVYTLLILILAGVAAPAQPYYGWRLGAGVGGAAYYGEVSYRLGTAKVSWPAYHLLLGRSLSPSLDVELNAGWGRFSANDRATDWRGDLRTDNPDFARGLHFRTRFRNAGLLLQYKFNNGYLLSQYARLAPYAFAGGGITDFTVQGGPQRDGSFGTKRSAPENGASYATRVLTVPFGAGLRWHISDRFAADVRAGANYAFTDYLDNVKTGRGRDVYFTGGVALQYQFDLGRGKFRGPVAYAGSQAFTAPGADAVAVSGNRVEWEDIERLRPDLDVMALDSDGPADLARSFVEEARVQPQPSPVRGPDAPEEAPKDLQLRDRGTGPDPATQTTQDFRRGNTTSQLAADNQRRYEPDGTRYQDGNWYVNTPPDQTRVQRLEWQVAELNRQVEALRQAIRRMDQSAPDNDSQATRTGNQVAPTGNNEVSRAYEEIRPNRPALAQLQPATGVTLGDLNEGRWQTARQLAVINSQFDALQGQQRQPLADPATEKRLDSLIAQVSRLNARLDAAPAAVNPPQREAMRNVTPEGTPAENGNTDSDDRDGTGFVALQRVAPAAIQPGAASVQPAALQLDVVQRQLDELRRSIDGLQNRVTAANGRTTLPNRLPYGPLVLYYPLNSAEMNHNDRQRLDRLIRGLGTDSSAVVEVKGFTDHTGNPAYNLELSRRRANNVRNYLVDAFGMKPRQIVINYFGQAMAAKEQENPYDRRVELEIYVAGK